MRRRKASGKMCCMLFIRQKVTFNKKKIGVYKMARQCILKISLLAVVEKKEEN